MAFNALNCPAVTALLQQVQTDYSLQDNLVVKYLGSPAPQSLPMPSFISQPAPAAPTEKKKRVIKEKPQEQMCTGTTAKGGPCKFVAKCDGLCGIHLRKQNAPVTEGAPAPAPKPKKVKEPKKAPEAPKHNHPLTEEPEETCMVCETQGNIMKPELTKAEFEAVADEGKSIQDRLKAILANADQDEEEPEEEEPEETESMEEEEEAEEEVSFRAKLAKMVADEDEVEEEEVDLEQMVETPPSQARLTELMAKLSTSENKTHDFDSLLEEMEEDEE